MDRPGGRGRASRKAVLAAVRGRQEDEIVAKLNEIFSDPEAALEQQGEAEQMLSASAARRLLESDPW